MKKLVLTGFLSLTLFLANAQEEEKFYFRFDESKINAKSENEADKHPLGDDIALKFQLLQESYTWIEPATPVNPTERTVVEKPSIYYSLKKLNSHYTKLVKKGEITADEATNIMNKALDVALCARHQNSIEFETKLKEIKEPQDIAQLYLSKVELVF